MKNQYGIVMGYYGPVWSTDALSDYADFCKKNGYGYFIYAPKQDDSLRKDWATPFTDAQISNLKNIRDYFENSGISFGIGISTYGLNARDKASDEKLKNKIAQINTISPSILGVFFDDIDPSSIIPELANGQVNVAEYAADCSTAKSFVTVPSYYSYDKILQRVLGKMPANYLEDFGKIDKKFEIFWTGQHIISPGYTQKELQAVSDKFKRNLSIWDNYPVNDPTYLKDFLRIFALTGRSGSLLQYCSSIALNPMLQPYASMIPLATAKILYDSNTEYNAREAYLTALSQLCGEELATTIDDNLNYFILVGTNNISSFSKERLTTAFSNFTEGMDQKIAADFLSVLQQT